MTSLETERLHLRRLTVDDAPFMLRLLNEPPFLRYIGDRGVRSLEDAQRYITDGPLASYDRHGVGPLLVVRKSDSAPIGICGLLKRDVLDDFDLGYAFVEESWLQGFAMESARAVLTYARDVVRLTRVVAATTAENRSSIRVLEKLGFGYERMVRLAPEEEEILLFGLAMDAWAQDAAAGFQ